MIQPDLMKRIEELDEMVITLDEDPTVTGLDAFNYKLSKLDAYQERLSTLHHEALKLQLHADLSKSAAQYNYDKEYNSKLASKPEVRNMKSADLRKATLHAEMLDLVQAREEAVQRALLADTYMKRVQQKYKDLNAKEKRLYSQVAVIQQLTRLDPSLLQDFMEMHSAKRQITLKTNK